MPDTNSHSRLQVSILILLITACANSIAASSRVYSSFPLTPDIEDSPRIVLPIVPEIPATSFPCHSRPWSGGWQVWHPPLLAYGEFHQAYGPRYFLVDGKEIDAHGRTYRAGSLYYPYSLPGTATGKDGEFACTYGTGQILMFLPIGLPAE